jgi:pilus assembly protein Flp/PilA
MLIRHGYKVTNSRGCKQSKLKLCVNSSVGKTMKKFLRDETGATSIEYGLIAVATGLALVAVMPTLKTKITATYSTLSAKM